LKIVESAPGRIFNLKETQHILSNINEITKTATCSICDIDVSIVKNTGKFWDCSIRKAIWVYSLKVKAFWSYVRVTESNKYNGSYGPGY